MSTQTVEIIRVEDHEGAGVCGHCGREGLRWIMVMSDGAKIGSGCVRKALGIPPRLPASYKWIAGLELVDSYTDRYGTNWQLYRSQNGRVGHVGRNGFAQCSGGYAAIEREYNRDKSADAARGPLPR